MHDLILTIVDRGFADDVMDAAKSAGARGGTILHARGTGAQEAEKFFGIVVQPEKELVMILVEHAAQYAVFAAADQNPPQSGTIFTIIKKKHPKRPICSSTSTARFCQRFSKPSLCVNAKTMFGSMIVAIHKSPQPLNQRMRIPPFRIRF